MNELKRERQYKLGLYTHSVMREQLGCPKCKKIVHVVKHGTIVNIYQRCDVCDKILGVPADAKTNRITEMNCPHCEAKNDIRLNQRWLCDNDHTFIAKLDLKKEYEKYIKTVKK